MYIYIYIQCWDRDRRIHFLENVDSALQHTATHCNTLKIGSD